MHRKLTVFITKYILFLLATILLTTSMRIAVADSTVAVKPADLKPVEVQPLAPGYTSGLGYELPAVGSYQLPSLGPAANGDVIDAQGNTRELFDVMGKKYTLLAFMYSTCGDVNGCPLTSYVFYQIRAAMRKDPQLAKNLQLISFSFDPEIDTPEVMRLYGNNFNFSGKSSPEWNFITTKSDQQLMPLLKSYNQEIQRKVSNDKGDESGFAHVLRVFLVDPQKNIRNIYSVAFLHPAILLTDIKTLISQNSVLPDYQRLNTASLSIPGDDKTGYETGQYVTNSLSIKERLGKSTDLMQFYNKPTLGLPPVPVPDSNPVTEEKIQLGRKLFFDRRLSLNNTFSCAMCHIPEQGFTNNELSIAVGIEGRSGRRNSPTIYNSAYADVLFHDGREETLEQQVWGPLLDRNEMANPSIGAVLKKIRGIPSYQGLFEQAFNGRGPGMETVGMALASYQRILVSGNSAFDQWYYAKKSTALNKSAKRGFKLFTGKAKCSSCHIIGKDYALFTDNALHNTGLGFHESMGIKPELERVQLAPGVYVDVKSSIIDEVGDKAAPDIGLYEVTQNPHDRWKYKTPGLRNIALTAPYMHHGKFSTLAEVVEFYNKGGVPNEVLDPLIKPLNLTKVEQEDLVAFMKSLTGDNTDILVSDAFAAPVGDITKDDPSWVHGSNVEVK